MITQALKRTKDSKESSLLNKVLRVSAQVHECLSAQVPFECPSAQMTEYPSAQVH